MSIPVRDLEQVVFNDGAGEDDEANRMVFDIGTNLDGTVWVSAENIDGDCTWFFNKENWELFKTNVEKRFK